MNDDNYTIESGHFSVGQGHKIYFQRWGNKDKSPIFHLHGGPGGKCSDKNKLLYDPRKHQVVFHDQRGSGLSKPFASTKQNTSSNLVEDIEKLRLHFNFKKISFSGHSWGSTLGLLYAIRYPEQVHRLLLSGIFTGTRREIDYIQQGGLKTHFPDAWEDFISLVPKNARDNTGKYYLEKILHGTQEEIERHVLAWNRLESSALSIDSDYPAIQLGAKKYEESARSLALIEAHYFVNNCFIADNYILDNAHVLKNIETVLVHGRFDHVCPPDTAFFLSRKIGKNCHLHLVPSSHDKEGSMREVQRAYAWSFL